MLLKCLIEVYHLLVQTDPYYVLADLYLRDYCIWVQHARLVYCTTSYVYTYIMVALGLTVPNVSFLFQISIYLVFILL